MLHGKAFAVVIAYNICFEVCGGKLNKKWNIENPV
jgi:hypothetical protein